MIYSLRDIDNLIITIGKSTFFSYPQAAASTIAIQNASVNDVFKNI
jgi:hypothetical protein